MNSELVYIPGWGDAVVNAVRWLRDHKNIPEYQTVDEEFAAYFGCKVVAEMMDPPYDNYPARVYAVFTKQDAVAFLLRWA